MAIAMRILSWFLSSLPSMHLAFINFQLKSMLGPGTSKRGSGRVSERAREREWRTGLPSSAHKVGAAGCSRWLGLLLIECGRAGILIGKQFGKVWVLVFLLFYWYSMGDSLGCAAFRSSRFTGGCDGRRHDAQSCNGSHQLRAARSVR